MHDIRAIKENPEAFDAAMVRRGSDVRASSLLAIDDERKIEVAGETRKELVTGNDGARCIDHAWAPIQILKE